MSACTGVPEGVTPVTEFDAKRYIGTWYEIARLDHPFERGLSNVTATYALLEDGSVSVTNRGYNREKCEWDEVEGRADFQVDPSIASLSVRFFGPFGGGYHVFSLDKEDYSYAMVSALTKDYLWLLARSPELNSETKSDLIEKASKAGFPVDELIIVDHNQESCG